MRSHERLMVVPYKNQQMKKRVIVFLLLISALGLFAFGYMMGQSDQEEAYIKLSMERKNLNVEAAKANKKLALASQQLANFERGKAIDVQAEQDVKKVLLSLKEENRQLNEELLFYKQIMAPSRKESTLRIDRIVISANSEPNKFHYQLVLAKVGNNRQIVNGSVFIEVTGVRNNKKVTGVIEKGRWREVKPSKSAFQAFKFRYFQELEGDLALPADFTPTKIQVTASALIKKKKRTVVQNFNWALEKG